MESPIFCKQGRGGREDSRALVLWEGESCSDGISSSDREDIRRMNHSGKTKLERFLGHAVITDGCWNWTAALSTKGYGKFKVVKRTQIHAHRWIWEYYNGPISDGLFVCHHCDNPKCVNPDHLFLGTHLDNMEDAFKKGRIKRVPVEIDGILYPSTESAMRATGRSNTYCRKRAVA